MPQPAPKTAFQLALAARTDALEALGAAIKSLGPEVHQVELRAELEHSGQLWALLGCGSSAGAFALLARVKKLVEQHKFVLVQVDHLDEAAQASLTHKLGALKLKTGPRTDVDDALNLMRQAMSGPPVMRMSFADAEDLLGSWARHVAEGAMWVGNRPPGASDVLVTFVIPGHELSGLKGRVVNRPPLDGRAGFWLEVAPSGELLAYVERSARAQRQGQRSALAPQSRRAFDRFETALAVQFENFPDLAAEYVTNISRGGLFIRSSTPPPMRSQVDLSLKLPDGQVVQIKAEVVHRISSDEAAARGLIAGVGVSFVGGAENPAFAPIEALLAKFSEHRPKLLLVDGESPFRQALVDALVGSGVEVATASDGRQALLTLIDDFFSFDLLVTELNIPQLDGWALIRRIRQSGGEVGLKVVVLTSDPAEALAGQADAAGPTRVLRKSQPLAALVASLRAEVGLS